MDEVKLLSDIKELESQYLKPHSFKQYKNYWLPEYIVKQSTNVLSLGVHRDVGWEQAMLVDNPDMIMNLYDPTPDSVHLFEQEFPGKHRMTFHQVAYSKDNGTMKFYYDNRDLTKCYSLLPLPQFGENPAHIEVETQNLKTILENIPQPDIIKADIEGVWYDFCREILDNDIQFKAFLIEFEVKLIDNEKSLEQYEELLKEFKDKGFDMYLNRARNKCLSEAVILGRPFGYVGNE
jgi:FkbM family methyltransferase